MYKILLCASTLSDADSYPSTMVKILTQALCDHDVWLCEIQKPEKQKKDPKWKQLMITKIDEMLDSSFDFVMHVGDLGITKGGYSKSVFKGIPTIEFNPKTTSHKADYLFTHLPKGKDPYIGMAVLDEFLYPEERQTEKTTVWVDHNSPRNDVTQQILDYLYKISQFYPIRVLFQNNFGITQDHFLKHDNEYLEYHKYDYDVMCALYRKADIYFLTHRETQGLNAVEMGMCGATIVTQPHMLPQNQSEKLPCVVYNDLRDLKWDRLIKSNDRQIRSINMRKTWDNFNIGLMRERLNVALKNAYEDSISNRGI